ncbi:DEAD-box ATP-dependent RNA helicase 31-like isoform X2 [Bidens hawaiensis]|uniref:DEAD-box ATP-dependent RNA helicase 31-like isoform X2 n=1 Tax=Bidens hawaiensis TaxID=980011 RepID=UPI00404AD635
MPAKLLSLPEVNPYNSSSLPVTLITMKTLPVSNSAHVFTRLTSTRLNSQSISSFNNLGFQKLTTAVQSELQFSIKHSRLEIRAAKSLIEDESELGDWFGEVNSGSFKKREVFSDRDDRRSSFRGGIRGGRGGSRGGGGSGMNRRNDDYNGGYDNNRERRGGGGSRGSFGGNSRGRGRFDGRGGGSVSGRGRGRFGGEVQRRDDRFGRDSDNGKGGWGDYYSRPEGKEPYVRDTDRFGGGGGNVRDTDRFGSNRRDDRFSGGGGRGRGRGGGRARGGGVTMGVKRSMERGSLMVSVDEDVDDEEDEAKLMYNYRDLISEDDDDGVDDEEDDVLLEKEHSLSLPRVPMEGSESYLSETRFDECSVSPLSLKGIKDAGYEKMTIVQEATLPVILKGKDVLAKARTGTGKTVAFLLPSIEVVVNSPPVARDQKWPQIQVLVICPTRELASQAAMEANKLLKYHPSVGVQVVIGGTRIATEQRRLQTNPCQILVATPGRLKDHIMNTSGFATRVKGVKVLVLDEADHLLDMGFRKDIEIIISAVPKQRQTLLFSATVPPEVRQICHIALKRDHEYINTVEEGSEETHTQVQQKHMIAPLDNQFPLLYTLLKDHITNDADYKVLVFCTTAMVTQLVADILGQMKLNVREIHSRKSQSYRTQVSDEFRKSKGLILVTSDVSARGVDYPDVTLVIQIGLPSDKAQYIHRLGRTGRKGKEGEGILLLAPWEEFFLSTLSDLPISKADPPVIDPDTKKKVSKALSYVDMKIKEMAYQAWLGYYNSNKTVARDKSRLVELANEFSRSMGLDTPPAISKLVLGKMGLKNVPGLRFK